MARIWSEEDFADSAESSTATTTASPPKRVFSGADFADDSEQQKRTYAEEDFADTVTPAAAPDRPGVLGALADMGVGALRGVVAGGETALRAARTAVPSEAFDAALSKPIDYLSAIQEKQFLRPSAQAGESELRRSLSQGSESATQSLTSMVPGVVGGALTAGPIGAAVGGATSGGTIFGLAQYDELREDYKKRTGVDLEEVPEAWRAAIKSSLSEAGTEAASDLASNLIFGGTGKALTLAGKGVVGGAKEIGKAYVKGVAKAAPFEVGSEAANAAIQDVQRPALGLERQGSLEAAKSAVGPSLVTTALMGAGQQAAVTARPAAQAIQDIQANRLDSRAQIVQQAQQAGIPMVDERGVARTTASLATEIKARSPQGGQPLTSPEIAAPSAPVATVPTNPPPSTAKLTRPEIEAKAKALGIETAVEGRRKSNAKLTEEIENAQRKGGEQIGEVETDADADEGREEGLQVTQPMVPEAATGQPPAGGAAITASPQTQLAVPVPAKVGEADSRNNLWRRNKMQEAIDKGLASPADLRQMDDKQIRDLLHPGGISDELYSVKPEEQEAPPLYEQRVQSAEEQARRPEITEDMVRRALPAAERYEALSDNGGIIAHLPGDRRIWVKPTGEIYFDKSRARAAGYSEAAIEGGKPAASWSRNKRDALIQLTQDGVTELDHEVFHDVMALALDDSQRAAVARQYGADEEAAARAYNAWKNDPQRKPDGIWQRVKDWAQALVDATAGRASLGGTFRGVETGKAYREAGERADRNDEEMYSVKPALKTKEFQDFFSSSKVVDDEGNPLVVYHGGKRPDRIGTIFREDRATSGPMAFFTDDPTIASNYSTSKADTSFEPPNDYNEWFQVQVKGRRNPANIDQAWYTLTPEQRAVIAARLPHVVNYDVNDNEIDGYRLGGENEYGLSDRDHWEYEIRQAHGNVLKAAKEIWLAGGTLFNNEEKFLDVLHLGGMDGVKFISPWRENPAVYPVHLNITKPFDTSVDVTPEFIAGLRAAVSRSRARPRLSRGDIWDKNSRDGRSWVDNLERDTAAEENSHVWTSIPDSVTNYLKSQGFDGIHDTGGKMGGDEHSVWIPFYRHQVKSATGNVGTYGQRPPTREEAKPLGMTAAQAARAQEKGDIRFSIIAEQRNTPDKYVKHPGMGAGRLNLWRMEAPTAVKQMISDMVQTIEPGEWEAALRTHTQQEILAEAKDASNRSKHLAKIAGLKPGDTLGSDAATYLGLVHVAKANELAKAVDALAKDPGSADLIAKVAELKADFDYLNLRERGNSAETARALNTRKILKKRIAEMRVARGETKQVALEKILETAGLTAEDLAGLASIPNEDVIEQARFIKQRLGADNTWGDWINGYRYMNMLLTASANVNNILGNSVMVPWNTMSEGLARGFDAPWRSRVIAHASGIGQSAKSALDVIFRGMSRLEAKGFIADSKYTTSRKEFKGGGLNPINLSTRLMRAGDTFFSEAAFNGYLREAAMDKVEADSVKPGTAEYTAALSKALQNLDVMDAAWTKAKRSTFNNQTKMLSTMMAQMRKIEGVKGKTLRATWGLLVPFARIAANIGGRMIEVTPGIGGVTYQKGHGKQVAATQALAIAATTGIASLIGQGLIQVTRGAPDDPDEREEFYAPGAKAWSVKIGDHWFDYRKTGPLAIHFVLASTIMEDWKEKGEVDIDTATKTIAASGKAFIDTSFVNTLGQMFDLMTNYDRYKGRVQSIGSNLIRQFVPFSGTLGQITRSIDPKLRDVKDDDALVELANRIKVSIPGVSETVPPRIDKSGREVERRGESGGYAWIPIKGNVPDTDADVAEAARLRAEQSKAEEPKAKLSRKDIYAIEKAQGEAARAAEAKVMQSTNWNSFSTERKVELLDKARRKARKDAKKKYMDDNELE